MKFNPFNRQKRQQNKIFTGSSGSGLPAGKAGKDSIRIIPLGGTGNVTKNMFVYEYRYDGKIRDILIVDCGIGFPDEEMYRTFNCGIGFILSAPEDEGNAIVKEIKKAGFQADLIGKTTKGTGKIKIESMFSNKIVEF
ncbi:MAG: Phosphoribosylformylglycinamidine cyclo-ligase [Microgenomates group bacterium GW2011_GWC1_49_7]|nr:MAG: Phosphoribosylformylglycinamidine cyclo-ligase [Microgenomates group bacterium GW2011_GWC1_49_7]